VVRAIAYLRPPETFAAQVLLPVYVGETLEDVLAEPLVYQLVEASYLRVGFLKVHHRSVLVQFFPEGKSL